MIEKLTLFDQRGNLKVDIVPEIKQDELFVSIVVGRDQAEKLATISDVSFKEFLKQILSLIDEAQPVELHSFCGGSVRFHINKAILVLQLRGTQMVEPIHFELAQFTELALPWMRAVVLAFRGRKTPDHDELDTLPTVVSDTEFLV